MEEKEIVLELPEDKTIPCLTCKWGLHNFMAEYCVKYDIKPSSVYYKNQKCDKYEPINNNKI